MKHLFIISSLLFMISQAHAQDEGSVVKRERIDRDKSIFVGGGISTVLGNNFGDYSTGINFEGGYLKRVNRIISLGGSVSYVSFKYDAKVLENAPNKGDFPANFYYHAPTDDGYLLNLKGGDVTLLSLAFNIKINFVPVKDNSKISVYAFAKPFISSSKRSEVNGKGVYYYYDKVTALDYVPDPLGALNPNGSTGDDTWGKSLYPILGEKSNITGGIFIGPGIEFFPAKAISIFLQASFGYTFPINIVSTRSYGNTSGTKGVDYNDDNFPMKDLSFTSINFAGGISFNLD